MYKDLATHNLLSLIVDRDKNAFQEFYGRYWDRIFTVCMNRVRNQMIAEDLVQDIFISIWEHKNLLEIRNIEAYLSQAVKYSVIKYFHKSSRELIADNDQLGVLDKLTDLSVEDVLHSKILNELLFDEIERLPERTKIIFQYSRIEHLSSSEIAEKLDLSHRTVENQISNALKSLRKFLKNVNFFMFF